MRRLSVLLGGAAGMLAGCAGPCEDDGFGQDCPSVGSRGSTGASPSSDGSLTPSGSSSSATPSGSMSASGEASTTDDASSGDTDSDSAGSSTTAGVVTSSWCVDADGDGFGDPDSCTDVPDGDDPPANTVDNDADCDDTDAATHPGAATLKNAGACTKDADGDGYGDANPPAGVDPGTDCDDASDVTYPGAAEQEPGLCALDADDDGYGAADPGPGVDAGTDCIDDNASAFPGAAELEDDTACMEDADDDGYGDAMPPAGAMAGLDCDDGDTDVPATTACFVWCNDVDMDQYGDPADCVFDIGPPVGYVGNNADCDDNNPNAFPGAAPNDDDMACMEDADGDDYGDEAPPGGIDAGTDCDDADASLTDQCIPCTPDEIACNGDDDLTQCNANGTFPDVIEDCMFGCDDVGLACWPELTVVATADGAACAATTEGGTIDLAATAVGGDSNYGYQWAPAATLDDANAQSPVASPAGYTNYTVDVSDGEGNGASDDVAVHVTDVFTDLLDPHCQDYTYPDPFGAAAPADPNLLFFTDDAVMCNGANSRPHAYVCDAPYGDAVVTWRMQVTTVNDDDALGFVWGWQGPGQFYVLSWKQSIAFGVFGFWFEGITIKRVDAPDQASVTASDLFAPFDTTNSVLLAAPFDFYDQGWEDNVEYTVTLTLDGSDHTIDIDNFDTGADVAEITLSDGAYPAGSVGFFDASQQAACAGFIASDCLE